MNRPYALNIIPESDRIMVHAVLNEGVKSNPYKKRDIRWSIAMTNPQYVPANAEFYINLIRPSIVREADRWFDEVTKLNELDSK